MSNHGHAKSRATTTALIKKANALSPKIAFGFMGHRSSQANAGVLRACCNYEPKIGHTSQRRAPGCFLAFVHDNEGNSEIWPTCHVVA